MNERELRILRSLTNELRAFRQVIESAIQKQQATNDANNQQPIPTCHVEVIHPPDLDPARREYYEAQNKERNSLWRKLKPWVEAVGVVIAFVLAWFNLSTLHEIQKQTPKIAESADASLGTSIVSVQQMRTSEEANWLTRANSIANGRQSRMVLDASITQMRLDQRAWIAINSGNAPKIAAGTKIGFQLQMINSGHTFALRVIQRAGYRTLPKRQPLDFDDQLRKIPALSQGAIGPGGSRIIDQTVETPLSADDAVGLLTGAEIFYVFGKISYLDIFRQEHWTKFCMMLHIHPDTQNGFTACESAGSGYTYNDAD